MAFVVELERVEFELNLQRHAMSCYAMLCYAKGRSHSINHWL